MSLDVVPVTAGSAHAALAEAVAAAKGGEVLRPVTVLVPTNAAGVIARRTLGRLGGVAAVDFLTLEPARRAPGRAGAACRAAAAGVDRGGRPRRAVGARQHRRRRSTPSPSTRRPSSRCATSIASCAVAGEPRASTGLAQASRRGRDVARICRLVDDRLAPIVVRRGRPAHPRHRDRTRRRAGTGADAQPCCSSRSRSVRSRSTSCAPLASGVRCGCCSASPATLQPIDDIAELAAALSLDPAVAIGRRVVRRGHRGRVGHRCRRRGPPRGAEGRRGGAATARRWRAWRSCGRPTDRTRDWSSIISASPASRGTDGRARRSVSGSSRDSCSTCSTSTAAACAGATCSTCSPMFPCAIAPAARCRSRPGSAPAATPVWSRTSNGCPRAAVVRDMATTSGRRPPRRRRAVARDAAVQSGRRRRRVAGVVRRRPPRRSRPRRARGGRGARGPTGPWRRSTTGSARRRCSTSTRPSSRRGSTPPVCSTGCATSTASATRPRAASSGRCSRPSSTSPPAGSGRIGAGVTIGSLAGSVGLVADLAIVLGAADGLMPSPPSVDPLIADGDRRAAGLATSDSVAGTHAPPVARPVRLGATCRRHDATRRSADRDHPATVALARRRRSAS